jgi:uncharacterized protein (TIGR02118 family)
VIKRISLVRRREGISHEEFAAHWMGPHADIVKQLPGLRGLRFGIVQSWTPAEAAWDGVGEIWFDSTDDAITAFSTEPYRTMIVADRDSFLVEVQNCFVEEYTAVAPPV